MARTTHTITYQLCGHTARTQVSWEGKAADRDRKIAWIAETQRCDDCKAAQRAAEKAEWDAQAEGRAATSTLTGSDKQVAWAEQVRSHAAAAYAAVTDRLTNTEVAELLAELKRDDAATGQVNPDSIKRVRPYYNAERMTVEQVATVLAITEARWWIDHRREDAERLHAALLERS